MALPCVAQALLDCQRGEVGAIDAAFRDDAADQPALLAGPLLVLLALACL
jgi:hypothetical protein